MKVFIVRCGDEHVIETTSLAHAVEEAEKLNTSQGENTATIWLMDTNNPSRKYVRLASHT